MNVTSEVWSQFEISRICYVTKVRASFLLFDPIKQLARVLIFLGIERSGPKGCVFSAVPFSVCGQRNICPRTSANHAINFRLRKTRVHSRPFAAKDLPYQRLCDETRLNVQVFHIEGVVFDELSPRLDLVPHEDREEPVGLDRVLDADLEECAFVGVHGGFPELFRVHLA